MSRHGDPCSERPRGVRGAGACTQLANGATCSTNGECASASCVDGVCCNSPCTGLCQACTAAKKGAGANGACGAIVAGIDPDNECPGADVCSAGACKELNGSACSAATECLSGNCIDGVCCNTACGALCQACNIAGSIGTCANVPAGSDPASECAGAVNCNGAGACGS